MDIVVKIERFQIKQNVRTLLEIYSRGFKSDKLRQTSDLYIF